MCVWITVCCVFLRLNAKSISLHFCGTRCSGTRCRCVHKALSTNTKSKQHEIYYGIVAHQCVRLGNSMHLLHCAMRAQCMYRISYRNVLHICAVANNFFSPTGDWALSLSLTHCLAETFKCIYGLTRSVWPLQIVHRQRNRQIIEIINMIL